MTELRVRWQVTEVHEAVIDIPDYNDEEGVDADLLADYEDDTSYEFTPDRTVLEVTEVDYLRGTGQEV